MNLRRIDVDNKKICQPFVKRISPADNYLPLNNSKKLKFHYFTEAREVLTNRLNLNAKI